MGNVTIASYDSSSTTGNMNNREIKKGGWRECVATPRVSVSLSVAIISAFPTHPVLGT